MCYFGGKAFVGIWLERIDPKTHLTAVRLLKSEQEWKTSSLMPRRTGNAWARLV